MKFLADNFFPSIWWVNILLIIWVIYLGRKKSARSTMMWVMVLSILPFFGFLIYLMLGLDRRKADMFRIKSRLDNEIRRIASTQSVDLAEGNSPFDAKLSPDYAEIVALNLNTGNSVLTGHNSCSLFFDGKDKFRSLFRDIDEAKETIDMQYYIMKSDAVGLSLMNRLASAARRGVRVRLLVDAVGGRGFRNEDIAMLRKAGVEFFMFFPFIFKYLNPRLNYRNHRKLVIIDDHIGYIGGFNVGDEYLHTTVKFGYWRDTHLRIDGDAAAYLKVRFLQDWFYASGKDPEKEPSISVIPHPSSETSLQLVTSGPDTVYPNIKYAMLKMVYSAREAIYIQTPYLVPDQVFLEALKLVMAQGVEVYIMIPNKPDHPIVYWATTSYAGELLDFGAHIYRYEKGFLHAKVLVVDDRIAMVGSANIDERSFALNFEASQLIFSKEINAQLREQFAKDADDCTLITREMYRRRPLIQRIKEPISRLFSPIL